MDGPAEGDDRYFSMSITSFGPCTLPQKKPVEIQTRQVNQTADVEGATQPPSRYERFGNRPEFSQSDVLGSTSKPLIRGRNCRDNALFIDDIPGARPKVLNKFVFTNRCINPLEPEYKLPSFEAHEPYEPKFIRDTMNISDIDGTKTKPLHKYETRDLYHVDDIVGAQPNWRPRHA